MSESRPDERSAERADDLLPEERAAGSDAPAAQAAAILADSDDREAARDAETTGLPDDDADEHRRSEDTVRP